MKLLYLIPEPPVVPGIARFVARMATQMGRSVHIVIASSDPQDLDVAQSDFNDVRQYFQDVDPTIEAVQSSPVNAMVDAQKAVDYDLMLVGARRRRRLIPSQSRILSQRLIKHSRIPVLLVRNNSTRMESMLVCTGGMKTSDPVVKLSSRLAGEAHVEATLLTVSAAVPSMYTGMEEMDETLEEILESDTPLSRHLRESAKLLTDHGISAEIKIRHGDVVEAILEETIEGQYDLVVLGEHEESLRGMLMGNVTQQIINRSPSAVLIVK